MGANARLEAQGPPGVPEATFARVVIAAGLSAYGWLREVIERMALTSTSRACSRSPHILTSSPAPSSVDDHTSTGVFILMNSHLSTSPKRAKRTGSSLSASLPSHELLVSRCACGRARSAGDLLWSGRTGIEAPTEHVEVAFGVPSLFKRVVKG